MRPAIALPRKPIALFPREAADASFVSSSGVGEIFLAWAPSWQAHSERGRQNRVDRTT